MFLCVVCNCLLFYCSCLGNCENCCGINGSVSVSCGSVSVSGSSTSVSEINNDEYKIKIENENDNKIKYKQNNVSNNKNDNDKANKKRENAINLDKERSEEYIDMYNSITSNDDMKLYEEFETFYLYNPNNQTQLNNQSRLQARVLDEENSKDLYKRYGSLPNFFNKVIYNKIGINGNDPMFIDTLEANFAQLDSRHVILAGADFGFEMYHFGYVYKIKNGSSSEMYKNYILNLTTLDESKIDIYKASLSKELSKIETTISFSIHDTSHWFGISVKKKDNNIVICIIDTNTVKNIEVYDSVIAKILFEVSHVSNKNFNIQVTHPIKTFVRDKQGCSYNPGLCALIAPLNLKFLTKISYDEIINTATQHNKILNLGDFIERSLDYSKKYLTNSFKGFNVNFEFLQDEQLNIINPLKFHFLSNIDNLSIDFWKQLEKLILEYEIRDQNNILITRDILNEHIK